MAIVQIESLSEMSLLLLNRRNNARFHIDTPKPRKKYSLASVQQKRIGRMGRSVPILIS